MKKKPRYKILGGTPTGGHWLFPRESLSFTQINRYIKRIPPAKGFTYSVAVVGSAK
tara:strand:+ start:554 stop:721 length:168 start_codon:yes stop_codon:yes gene_type:complete